MDKINIARSQAILEMSSFSMDTPSIRDVKASRPNWPRGQNFGLGLGLVTFGLGLGLGLGTLWPRPEAFGLGLEL